MQSVSARKAQANRQNALKSTGPKTLSGKAYSQRNSLKHGLFAKGFCCAVQGEDPQEFQDLRDKLLEKCQPVGMLEEIEVDRIADCCWRLKRASRYENAKIAGEQVDVWIRLKTKLRELLPPKDRDLLTVLESVMKGIEETGEIPSKLLEEMFALDPSFRERWGKLDKMKQVLDKLVGQRVQESGMSVGEAENAIKKQLNVPPDTKFARLTPGFAITAIESGMEKRFEGLLNIAIDSHAILAGDALDNLLRCRAAIKKDLDRALDRLERLQRRREGEPVPPPVSVHLTR